MTCPSSSTSPTVSALCTSVRWLSLLPPMSCSSIRSIPIRDRSSLLFLFPILSRRRADRELSTILLQITITPKSSPLCVRFIPVTSFVATRLSIRDISRFLRQNKIWKTIYRKRRQSCFDISSGVYPLLYSLWRSYFTRSRLQRRACPV